MFTAVTGLPAKLIRRFPNRLIRMALMYVVYDLRYETAGAMTRYERTDVLQPRIW